MRRRKFVIGTVSVTTAVFAGCVGANSDDGVPDNGDDDPGGDEDDGGVIDDGDNGEDVSDIDITDVEFDGFDGLDVRFTLHNSLDEEVTIDTWFTFFDGSSEVEEWSRLIDVPANETLDESVPNIIDEDTAEVVTHINVIGAMRVDGDWETPVDDEYDASIFEKRYEDVLSINGLEIVEHEFEPSGNSRIRGVVENNSGETYESVAIRVIPFDSNRDPISNASVDDTGNLADGEAWEFTAYLNDEQVDNLDDYRIRILDESPFN